MPIRNTARNSYCIHKIWIAGSYFMWQKSSVPTAILLANRSLFKFSKLEKVDSYQSYLSERK